MKKIIYSISIAFNNKDFALSSLAMTAEVSGWLDCLAIEALIDISTTVLLC